MGESVDVRRAATGRAAGGLFATRAFDLGTGGVAFYAFPEIPEPKPCKDAYRA